MTDLNLRRAADRRRAQAERAGERDGDDAYRLYRSQVPGLGAHRPTVTMPTQLRAEPEKRNGIEVIHTWGAFTTYDRPYEMWDDCGKYHETIDVGSGEVTLSANPDVAFLVNHKGVTMARTRSRTKDATLVLREKPTCGWHDAYLNPERQDVRDFYSAVKDELITEMSFAFMIPNGMGQWTSDFTLFHIRAYDIDRGDVSGVNFGANPHTDIAARSADWLRELEHLPRGARAEALARLGGNELVQLQTGQTGVTQSAGVTEFRSIEVDEPTRERIEVRGVPRVDRSASMVERRWQNMRARYAERYADLAQRTGLPPSQLAGTPLPWYEIRAPQHTRGNGNGADRAGQTETDVLIYDEIGGKLGVSAKQFAIALAKIDSDVINVRINSPGGSVTDAFAIRSSMKHHPAFIRTIVDGIAASAATIIALGGDEVVTMEGAQLMFHDASTHADGNERELAALSKWIGRESGNAADLYAKRMGIGVEAARQMMLDETWMFADESVQMGIADRVGGQDDRPLPDDMTERMHRSFELHHFRYAGRAVAPAPQIRRDRGASTVPPAAPGPGPDSMRPDPVPEMASIAPEQQGRSLALIEALLDLED